ncbi:hypothetical protein JRQ81_015067 [Phrynocephalus forsythii]|uniref:Uncharacterized protein n=1 Tax=Phrynocephalus forsythii TaxID=171643 RepID=A0A9Q0XYL0_9SAUR|nr:hypothetical protein JRQ81_015067 [Phrynocephalus forsythii]
MNMHRLLRAEILSESRLESAAATKDVRHLTNDVSKAEPQHQNISVESDLQEEHLLDCNKPLLNGKLTTPLFFASVLLKLERWNHRPQMGSTLHLTEEKLLFVCGKVCEEMQ